MRTSILGVASAIVAFAVAPACGIDARGSAALDGATSSGAAASSGGIGGSSASSGGATTDAATTDADAATDGSGRVGRFDLQGRMVDAMLSFQRAG